VSKKAVLPLLAVTAALLVTCGCGAVTTPAQSAATGRAPGASAGALIVEPGAGAGPYTALIAAAKREVDVNSYLLTDREVVRALEARARAGVAVRVIVAGNPYRDAAAVARERAEFAGSPVRLRLAPARFERRYTFDHAKYVVVDPDSSGRAILGSSNLDYSGLGGGNREFDFETGAPAVVKDLAAVFDADWAGHRAGLDGTGALVLSPGAEARIVSLIRNARGRLDIESEELGYDAPVLDAVAAAARRGADVRIVLPARLSAADRRNAARLSAAGTKVRYLRRPYPHAKLIVAGDTVFLGSQNISESSLEKNREVGIMLTGKLADEAAAVFDADFGAAGSGSSGKD